ncbi:tRNA pseudouridine(38-40) synthase TruA [Desulforamulus ferrireducens]|uniref:tRNA pseudouridine synthase A n=1 Tax=Desulforamulus ferrireducens TaxID=1833852 RepID=A0A1S6IVV5_9FIRM|nr:tRNA pseudouridine(38-40) synthase TruA [Desulforamulus ferrireducens]AQS58901.1 tRNA pseudouridine(38-40) synthase TruA [Desulforamulus ferrireducens]
MRNLKLTIQYDGTRYKGWQRLGNTENTLQGKIEQVLSRMTGETIEIIGSGRTDMGVHAQGQVANFKTSCTKSVDEIQQYLYQYLPEDIVVSQIEEVDERFHARYHAVAKEYVYKIWNAPYHNPFLRKYVVHIPQPLNLEAMQRAVPYLLGEHDYSAFVSSRSKKKSNVRELYSIDITKQDSLIELTFRGNGFLHNMVRIITGTLLEVGHGRMKPAYLKEILERRDRTLAGPTAPAKGLHLVKVYY